jgi:SAM-dependent methyltransferase
MNEHEILEKIKKYDFYHHIKLTDNITTPGIGRSQIKVNIDEIKKINFKGKKVLDIGCRDGIYSFEAEKLGAKEVIGIDNDLSKAATEFLIPFFDSKIKMFQKNIFDLTEGDFGKFDIIIFPGVLYHLRYPFYALKIVTNLLKNDGVLILETAILNQDNNNAFLYCPINNDGPYGSTSCTFFNRKGLTDTLQSIGMKVTGYKLSIKENFFKNIIKKILNLFFDKTFLGKNLISVCRGIFICKKDLSLINEEDRIYWNETHERHTKHQKETKSYKAYNKIK